MCYPTQTNEFPRDYPGLFRILRFFSHLGSSVLAQSRIGTVLFVKHLCVITYVRTYPNNVIHTYLHTFIIVFQASVDITMDANVGLRLFHAFTSHFTRSTWKFTATKVHKVPLNFTCFGFLNRALSWIACYLQESTESEKAFTANKAVSSVSFVHVSWVKTKD